MAGGGGAVNRGLIEESIFSICIRSALTLQDAADGLDELAGTGGFLQAPGHAEAGAFILHLRRPVGAHDEDRQGGVSALDEAEDELAAGHGHAEISEDDVETKVWVRHELHGLRRGAGGVHLGTGAAQHLGDGPEHGEIIIDYQQPAVQEREAGSVQFNRQGKDGFRDHGVG